jgi:hypothetical protein
MITIKQFEDGWLALKTTTENSNKCKRVKFVMRQLDVEIERALTRQEITVTLVNGWAERLDAACREDGFPIIFGTTVRMTALERGAQP